MKRKFIVFLLLLQLFVNVLPINNEAQAETLSGIAGEYQTDTSNMPTGDALIPEYIELTPDELSGVTIYGEQNTSVVTAFSQYINSASGNTVYGYNSLTTAQKAFYTQLTNAFNTYTAGDYKTKNYTETGSITAFGVTDTNGLSYTDVLKVYFAFRHDNPQYYWISNYYSYSKTSPVVMYVIIDNYYARASDRLACDTVISKMKTEYSTAISGKTSNYDKIITIHDKIIKDIDYAYNSSGKPETSIWAHNIMGVFQKTGAVCEGYAKAFQYMLNILNINNVYIVGNGNGEAHAWNMVEIDGKYYYVDVTWDDFNSTKNGGINYVYFCMPASKFTSSHKAYTSSGTAPTWLYNLPAASDTMECTYYAKHNSYGTSLTSGTITSFLSSARAAAEGNYLHLLVDNTSINIVGSALGVSSYMPVNGYGNLFIVENYKATNPATSITLSKNSAEVNRDVSTDLSLTATMTSASGTCNDIVLWSVSGSGASIIGDGKTVTVRFKRSGTFTVTATAAVGKKSASCTVTVIGGSDSEHVYADSTFDTPIGNDDIIIWVNGGNVGKGTDKINYKQSVVYTDITASNIVTVSGGKTKVKTGKVIVGVTTSADTPALVKNKIVDTNAAKIAKATIDRNGKIKITAQKEAGTVYLWVYDLGDDEVTGYAQITVKAAPTKVVFLENAEATASYKKATAAIGEYLPVILKPTIKDGSIPQDATYTLKIDDKTKKYGSIVQSDSDPFTYYITSDAMDTAKPGKTVQVKATISCDQNGKKAVFTLTVTNPVVSIAPDFAANAATTISKVKGKESSEINLNLNRTSNSYLTTDKVAVYAMTAQNLTLVNNSLQGTKSDFINVKLNKNKDGVTVTCKKALESSSTNAYLYATFTNGKAVSLMYIGYVDKTTGEIILGE